MDAERLAGWVAQDAAAPSWWPALNTLRLVDGDAVVTLGTGAAERKQIGQQLLQIRTRSGGGAVVVSTTEIRTLSAALEDPDVLADTTEPGQLFTAGGIDPAGNLIVAMTSPKPRQGGNACYRLDHGALVQVAAGFQHVAAVAFTAAGSHAYVVDSAARRLWQFDADRESTIANGRGLVDFSEDAGDPGDVCVDVEGGVWVAMRGGGQARRYEANGRLSEVISLPFAGVSGCAFGGPGYDVLYLTLRRGATDPEDAGSVYGVRPGVAGAPVPDFDDSTSPPPERLESTAPGASQAG